MISSYPQSYVQQSQVGGRSFPPSLAAGLGGHGHGGHHNPNASPGPAGDGGLYDGSLPGYTAAAVAAAAAAAGSHQTALARVSPTIKPQKNIFFLSRISQGFGWMDIAGRDRSSRQREQKGRRGWMRGSVE
jgi:hypothetical protein